jgi:hypothetical protein
MFDRQGGKVRIGRQATRHERRGEQLAEHLRMSSPGKRDPRCITFEPILDLTPSFYGRHRAAKDGRVTDDSDECQE